MASSDEISEAQVKNFIKGIVTSNPNVSTIQSIQKDYKELIGTPIPFYKFKYNSVEHFLKSLPDTCMVQGTGPFAHVTLTRSEKSAHINEMVIHQKPNSKARRKSGTPRRRTSRGNGMMMNNNRRSFPLQSTFNYSFSPNTSASSSSVGYTTIATKSKNSAPDINTLATGIRNLNATKNNTNFAFTNNQTALSLNTSIQNTTLGLNCVNVGGRNIRTENTEAKRNYIIEQNKLESSRVKERLNNLIRQQVQVGNVNKVPTTSQPPNDETDTLSSSNNFTVPVNAPNLTKADYNYLKISNKEVEAYSKQKSDSQQDKICEKSRDLFFKSVEEEEDEDTSNVPKRVQCNLKTLISQFADGIWCCDVPEHYKRLFLRDLNYMEYGYTSLIEMCIALKHIFHYVRPGRDDFKLYSRSKPLPDSVEKCYTMASYDVGEKTPVDRALPELEWSDFKGHIPEDVFQYGNHIPTEFLPSDAQVDAVFDVVVVEIYDLSKFWFYMGTSERNTPLDELMDDMQAFYSNQENAKEYAIPPGAINSNHSDIKMHKQLNSRCKELVASLIHYFELECENNGPLLPVTAIREEGLYCVQVIYGEYHRAKIVRVLPDCPDTVRVFYIDYGTVCKAPVKGMCFLHSKFAELKAQAIRCRLANIFPELKGHPWPRSSINRFRELVNRRDTKIKISYIDWNEEYVCVFLADVTDSDNVQYINEILVKEGHAVWEGENQTIPFVLPNFKCKVQNLHLFPTFLELEYGLVPNASEMLWLEEMFTPLQFCIPQYFEPSDEILVSDEEDYEDCFIETVKNHRKFTQISNLDFNSVLNPPPIDFDIFGELKEEMIKFCNSIDMAEGTQAEEEHNSQEKELFCDVEETDGHALPIYNDTERNLEEFEPIRIIKEDKQLSESILRKLERYSLLESDHSSNSEGSNLDCGDYKPLVMPENCERGKMGQCKEFWTPEEIVEHDLFAILEQSDELLDTSDTESSKGSFFGFTYNNSRAKSDVNIFDNPEAFENSSESSEKSDSKRSVTPESFLRNVERISRKDSEDENSVCQSTTENSSATCIESGNPFIFNINPDLRDAYKSFLKSQKMSSTNNTTSNFNDTFNQSDEPVLSFLRSTGSKIRTKNVEEENSINGENGGSLPLQNKVDVSKLSLNNPFRTYLEDTPGDICGNFSVRGIEDDNTTEPAGLETTDSAAINLLEGSTNLVRTESSSTNTLESNGSSYKVFIPRESSNLPDHVRTRGHVESGNSSSATASGMSTLPGLVPTPVATEGVGPYPQWSNGGGFPVPSYSRWSNGDNYPAPYPVYADRRGQMRPPPGFEQYRGPPQGYTPNYQNFYMGPRNYQGPVLYGCPRPLRPSFSMPPQVPDYYERRNCNI